MAYYTTVDTVYNELPKLRGVTNLSSGDVNRTIGYSQAIVDAYIAKAYTVPVAGTVPLLESITTDIALYRLLRRFMTSDINKDSPWVERYQESFDVLKAIAMGMITLVDSAGSVVTGRTTGPSSPYSNTKGYYQTHHEGDWYNHFIDPDKIDDIETDRDLEEINY